jgi:threonine/homoserine/homoserine lactone efflux protein
MIGRRMPSLPIWSFLAITVPLVLTPGASTAVVLRNSVSGGIRAGVETAIGTNLASICYGLVSAFGLALSLRRWPSMWEVLRVGGTIYLAWLGVRSIARAVAPQQAMQSRHVRTLLSARGVPPPLAAAHLAVARSRRPRALSHGRWAHAIEGFLTNVLNPAIATFYLIILPQFIPSDAPAARSALMLTTVHVGLAASWHVTWAAAGGTLAHVLSSGSPRRLLDGLTGIALLFLAARMLF